MKQLRRILPIVISLALIVLLISYTPWSQVSTILADLSISTILLLVALSASYYALKVIRFHYMLKAMKVGQPFGKVALSYMSAQPVSLLPAGEIYRSHALERHTGVPVKDSIPQFTMQGILEGAAMALVGVICALALGTLRVPVLALTIVVLIAIIGIQQGYLTSVARALNVLPFVNLSRKRLQDFTKGNQVMLSRKWLPRLFIISFVSELVGSTIAYVSVTGLGGHLNVFQAGLLYVIPVVVGFISFLPGGFGASEQSAIAILLLSHVSVATAVAATLLMRVSIVGMGVIYGLGAFTLARTKFK